MFQSIQRPTSGWFSHRFPPPQPSGGPTNRGRRNTERSPDQSKQTRVEAWDRLEEAVLKHLDADVSVEGFGWRSGMNLQADNSFSRNARIILGIVDGLVTVEPDFECVALELVLSARSNHLP